MVFGKFGVIQKIRVKMGWVITFQHRQAFWTLTSTKSPEYNYIKRNFS
jgi:hypothetical protein